MRVLRLLAAAIFILCVPLAVVLTNVRLIVLDPSTYQWGFERYGAIANTGMTPSQLTETADQLIAYFDRGEPITLQITKSGELAPLFNEREMAHLSDVRALFLLAFLAQQASLAYIVAFSLLALVAYGFVGLRSIGRYLTWGGALTVAILLALFAVIQTDFDSFFLQFHLASFSNDLWMLDSRTDYMIRLFPQEFWMETFAIGALKSMAGGIVVTLLGGLLLLATRGYARFSFGRRRW